ncbi:glycosyltransferase family 1 protein [Parathielavia hyrcaniae]|uniref:Glycosyltransferase family 1 protein n=1 Tax=Parathielavia hyrcaniae TaxID=113614 RepID=A0AAN6QF25_9PEZI|nr:glycosyltransferase family 1 protein [Parathielavia hyrcaniae]
MSVALSSTVRNDGHNNDSPAPVLVETVPTTPDDNATRTLVVDKKTGNPLYPSYVPPETQAPDSTPDSPASQRQHDGGAAQQSKHAVPEGATDEMALDVHGPRRKPPQPAAKRWEAGVPPSRPPAGTSKPGATTDAFSSSSSSSSSDEDEEEEPTHRKGHKWKKGKPEGKKGKEDRYRNRFLIDDENFNTKGRISKRDGRLNISLSDTSNTGYLAKALGAAARKMVPLPKTAEPEEVEDQDKASQLQLGEEPSTSYPIPLPTTTAPPKLGIVIMIIGSRGDLQPFLRIAAELHTVYGHRVRIATHPAFESIVASTCPGVDFFSVGGDPSELMSFMVKNPGMIPTLSSVKAGDVGRRRTAMADMFEGFWGACCSPVKTTTTAKDKKKEGKEEATGREAVPFVADAIIANPPCFAHIHCAEALGVPLHLMFTFPYTPTQAFPHPLARIRRTNVEEGYTNWISYPLVDMMVWQGLGDLVNEFRVGTLGLDPVSTLWAPGSTYRLHVPFTYLWSPGLVPKPADWGDEIDVAGFVFVDLASSFEPPEELVKFLEGGGGEEEPPVYIGFGSIVVDDPDKFTSMIFEAVKMAGVRALVSKGWGGLGGDSLEVPPEVYLLDNTPHDWLFPKVRACVIHGGAGTVAAALKCGKPTMIVPFFGDQHFWGSMVGNAGAGPEAVPYKSLTVEKLADGIKYCITEEARRAAERIARDIEKEGDGAEKACQAFHRHLALEGRRSMRCPILPDRVAVWKVKGTGLRLSALATEMLVFRGLVSRKKLYLLRHSEWNDFEGPGEPLTGAAGALVTSAGKVFRGVGGVPYRIGKKAKERREKRKRKRENKKGQGDHPKESKPDGPSRQPDDIQQDAPPPVESTTDGIHRRDTASTAEPNLAEDVVREVGHGAAKSASALVKTPVDLSLALAQGFHNAGRLYGDKTVRRPTRITGIRSGLRAARREFVYGIYDGWTGVVRLPVRGAREDGACGFLSGVGMGLTGFVLKNLAALIGPVGYTLKGVAKETESRPRPVKMIRRVRALQGQREIGALPEEERAGTEEKVVNGWGLMRETWLELKRAEKRQEKGVKGSLHRGTKRLKDGSEWDVLFQNLDVTQRAMEALKRGEGLERVLEMGEDNADADVDAHATEWKEESAGDKAALGLADGSAHDSMPDGSAEKNNNAAAVKAAGQKDDKDAEKRSTDENRQAVAGSNPQASA